MLSLQGLIRKLTHIVCSLWLAMLLLFGATPKEFVHTFASHTDTIDSRLIAKGLVADQQHHHCSFISFNLMPFEQDFQPAVVIFYHAVFSTHSITLPASFIVRSVSTSSLRGPPTA